MGDDDIRRMKKQMEEEAAEKEFQYSQNNETPIFNGVNPGDGQQNDTDYDKRNGIDPDVEKLNKNFTKI